MNPARKRLKLVPSKPRTAVSSHGALLLPPAPAGGGVEVEKRGDNLLMKEDTTDSSLVITMGNTHTHSHEGHLGLRFYSTSGPGLQTLVLSHTKLHEDFSCF